MIKIFVEGECDKRLIEDYSNHLQIQEKIDVIYTGGKDKLKEQIPSIKRLIDQGFKILIIFDTDNDFNQRVKDLTDIKNQNKIDFDFFLFPNNEGPGTIEDLLLNVYNSKYQDVFDCLNAYEKCLKKNSNYKIPIKKGKVYGFLDAVLPEKEEDMAKDKKRNFLKYDHWNLDHEYLSPLKEFLLNATKTSA